MATEISIRSNNDLKNDLDVMKASIILLELCKTGEQDENLHILRRSMPSRRPVRQAAKKANEKRQGWVKDLLARPECKPESMRKTKAKKVVKRIAAKPDSL
ncbi:hypothetical protein B0A50_03645 [Salinomyces thailandicus]|uniref:Uncharacterized protein n=1 Tax=Salinomyces thailandicus TaxID=706561 RepID=A0A4U0U4Q9_9PEZI|nr:hypothetical protein B0A50_03645 [Salinomyces thailandica]